MTIIQIPYDYFPSTVRGAVLLVLTVAFVARISMVYKPLRRLAASIDDDLENRGMLANLNNVSELFLKPSIKKLGKSFIFWEILTLVAPLALAIPLLSYLEADEVQLGNLERSTYSIFVAFLVIWLARDIRKSARLRDFIERSYIQLEAMWTMAEREFQSWNLNHDFRRSWFLNELKQAESQYMDEADEIGIIPGIFQALTENPIVMSFAKQIKKGLDYTILAPFSNKIHSTVMGIIRTRMNQIVEEQLEDFKKKSPLRRANAIFEAFLPTFAMSLVVLIQGHGL